MFKNTVKDEGGSGAPQNSITNPSGSKKDPPVIRVGDGGVTPKEKKKGCC